MNPSSISKEEGGGEERREDDGTGRRRKRRLRKIPEINFEMEKGERKKQQQQQLRREVEQRQQQQFSITETLPEHFRKALMKSLFPKEEEDTADARDPTQWKKIYLNFVLKTS